MVYLLFQNFSIQFMVQTFILHNQLIWQVHHRIFYMGRKARGTNFNFKQQCVCEWSQKAKHFLGRPLWEINITGNTTLQGKCRHRAHLSCYFSCYKLNRPIFTRIAKNGNLPRPEVSLRMSFIIILVGIVIFQSCYRI